MTAEKIFSEWLKKQDYWIKKLYWDLRNHGNISDDDVNQIISSYISNTFDEVPYEWEEEQPQSIVLKKLYGVKGVNRLLADQEIAFGDNLTVIYGENGTGKTGYSRIIQQIGKYIGEVVPIKPNVFANDIQPQAKIDYVTGNNSFTLEWSQHSDVKLNVKLFNSDCVHFSLNSDRKIDFTPHIFYIIEQLSIATQKLNAKVQEKIQSLSTSILSPIISATEVYQKIDNIIKTRKPEEVIAFDILIKKYSIDELEKKRENLLKKLDKLSITVLDNEIKQLNLLDKSIEQIIDIIDRSEFYSKKQYKTYRLNLKTIKELRTQSNIESILSKLQIQDSIKQPFIEFILAADKFYKVSVPKGEAFSKLERCLFCGQSIDSQDVITHEILDLYNDLIQASKFDSIQKLEIENLKILENHKTVMERLTTLRQTQVVKDNNFISEHLDIIIKFFKELINDDYENNIRSQIEILTTMRETISINIKNDKEKIEEIDKNRTQVNYELNEVNAKINIYKDWNIVKQYLIEYINLSQIGVISNHAISKCQKEIQDKIYKQSFIEILQSTLSELKAPKEVQFNPVVSNSKMAIKQGYNVISKENGLNEILSEGEQTVVALAQFIAESKFNPNDNVLFFDDPVNSLDLKRMYVIAQVLVTLAKTKQIIIFTHNLVFLGYIKSVIEKMKELKQYKFYQTERVLIGENEYVGKVTERANPNVETYKYYKDKIASILKRSNSAQLELSEIELAYDYIRSGIEVLISLNILNGTTERYKHDISVNRFSKIKFDSIKEDQQALVDLYDNVCCYIPGHSSSLAGKIEPDIISLQNDFKTLNNIAQKYV